VGCSDGGEGGGVLRGECGGGGVERGRAGRLGRFVRVIGRGLGRAGVVGEGVWGNHEPKGRGGGEGWGWDGGGYGGGKASMLERLPVGLEVSEAMADRVGRVEAQVKWGGSAAAGACGYALASWRIGARFYSASWESAFRSSRGVIGGEVYVVGGAVGGIGGRAGSGGGMGGGGDWRDGMPGSVMWVRVR
jgi:hypothetical protein